MIDGIPNRPLYFYKKGHYCVVQQIVKLCNAARSLSWTCFSSQAHAISLSPNDTWMFMFEWERVFCPRSLPIQSWKQKTPQERCFNKARKGIWLRLASGMTRLVKQTRNRECRSLANPNITIGHVGGKLQHWHPGYAYIYIYIYTFLQIPTTIWFGVLYAPLVWIWYHMFRFGTSIRLHNSSAYLLIHNTF